MSDPACSTCGTAVPLGARFCPQCGTARSLPCGTCGTLNAAGHRFCSACGQGLHTAQAAPAEAAHASVPAPPTPTPAQTRTDHAERRQITVMFCDLADSTAMANGRDPEDFREIVHAYHEAAVKVIQDLGGHVAQYLGDGLLVYFGYPRAHEDAAARALHAAQGILGVLPALNARLGLTSPQTLRVRIGVHTGLVVVGDVGAGARMEQLAIGDAPNIAARLQGVAPPDGVVASAVTRNLVREPMDWRDLGELALKGIAQPLRAYALGGDGATTTGGAQREEAPLIGRESESAFLDGAWASARAAAGTVVLVSGEPGIGKSRLLAAACECVARDGGRTLLFRCSPYHTASDLHPVIDWLERALAFVPGEAPSARYGRLAQALHGNAPNGPTGTNDELELLAALLGLPLPEGHEPPRLTPQIAKQRTQAALVRWLLAQSAHEPLMLAFEDLHWADPSTLVFIQALTGELAGAPLMLLVTFRPEFEPTWPAAPRTVRLSLERLTRAGIEAIVSRLSGGRRLPDAVLRQIVANTDGVPLFVEEFTRTVLESGALQAHGDRFELRSDLLTGLIPESLRDSLAARLDRLGAGRSVARHAAVIGRRFEASLVAALAGLTAQEVDDGLTELTHAGLVYRVDVHASSERYEFKHALVQAAAYESLLRRERTLLHARVAQQIESRLPELAERQPELLAWHLTESQQWVPAVQCWLLAGQRCLARSANQEAISHLRAGLALVPHLPGDVREGLELALLSTIGPALIATTGFGSLPVGEAYTRARQLCEVMQDRPEFFPSLWGCWVYHMVSGRLATSRHIAEQMLELGQRTGDPAMLVEAHWTLGNSLFWLGQLAAADEQLALTPRYYDRERDAGNALRYGQDAAVAAECYRSYTLWALGCAEQALDAHARASQLAAQRDHIFTTGWVLAFGFMVRMFRREARQALSAAEATLAFSTEHGHPFWTAAAMVVRGWARARLAQGIDATEFDAGLAQLREGLALYEMTGSQVVQTLWYALLAELELDAGRLSDARAALDAGFAKAEAVGERLSEIELWRIQAEWFARQPVPDRAQAQRHFMHALAMARECGARSYGLRAATGLHRLLAHNGDAAALQASPLPAWLAGFSEGDGTPDLQDARAALAAASRAVHTTTP